MLGLVPFLWFFNIQPTLFSIPLNTYTWNTRHLFDLQIWNSSETDPTETRHVPVDVGCGSRWGWFQRVWCWASGLCAGICCLSQTAWQAGLLAAVLCRRKPSPMEKTLNLKTWVWTQVLLTGFTYWLHDFRQPIYQPCLPRTVVRIKIKTRIVVVELHCEV